MKRRTVAILLVTAGIVVAAVAIGLASQLPKSNTGPTAAFQSHLQSITFRNVTAVMADYLDNATLTWNGPGPGGFGGGTYGNKSAIGTLYNTFLTNSLTITISNVTAGNIHESGTSASVNASFYIDGRFSGGCGNFTGSIQSSVSLIQLGDKWWISKEVWTFGSPFSSGICG